VHEEVARVEVEEEVLAAPADAADPLPRDARPEVAGHGPAQAPLADHDAAHPAADHAGNETQAGRLDFREFRHWEWRGFATDYKAAAGNGRPFARSYFPGAPRAGCRKAL